jgi:hypothetical protein
VRAVRALFCAEGVEPGGARIDLVVSPLIFQRFAQRCRLQYDVRDLLTKFRIFGEQLSYGFALAGNGHLAIRAVCCVQKPLRHL